MADPSRHPGDDPDDRTVEVPDDEPTGIPRWVWVVGLVVLIVALLVGVVLLLGGGGHGGGPRLH